jgi:hypothetical protein
VELGVGSPRSQVRIAGAGLLRFANCR